MLRFRSDFVVMRDQKEVDAWNNNGQAHRLANVHVGEHDPVIGLVADFFHHLAHGRLRISDLELAARNPLLWVIKQPGDADPYTVAGGDGVLFDDVALQSGEVRKLGRDIRRDQRNIQEFLWYLAGGGQIGHFLPHRQIPGAQVQSIQAAPVCSFEGPAVKHRSFRNSIDENRPSIDSEKGDRGVLLGKRLPVTHPTGEPAHRIAGSAAGAEVAPNIPLKQDRHVEILHPLEKLVGENRGRSSRGLAGRLGYGRRLKKEKKREAAEPKIGFIHDPHP